MRALGVVVVSPSADLLAGVAKGSEPVEVQAFISEFAIETLAYPIWTGIGSVGSVLVGVFAFNQNLSMSGIAGLILLVAGMFLLGSDAH